jgi:hypothetical protein
MIEPMMTPTLPPRMIESRIVQTHDVLFDIPPAMIVKWQNAVIPMESDTIRRKSTKKNGVKSTGISVMFI